MMPPDWTPPPPLPPRYTEPFRGPDGNMINPRCPVHGGTPRGLYSTGFTQHELMQLYLASGDTTLRQFMVDPPPRQTTAPPASLPTPTPTPQPRSGGGGGGGCGMTMVMAF